MNDCAKGRAMNDWAFEIGDYVQRRSPRGQSWSANGYLVGRFRTLDGAERYNFEFEQIPRMVYIVSPNELLPIEVMHD